MNILTKLYNVFYCYCNPLFIYFNSIIVNSGLDVIIKNNLNPILQRTGYHIAYLITSTQVIYNKYCTSEYQDSTQMIYIIDTNNKISDPKKTQEILSNPKKENYPFVITFTKDKKIGNKYISQ